MSPQAANTVAAIYEEYAREGAQTRAQRRSQFIAQSLDEQAVSLKRSQDSLRDFQERNKTSDVTDEQTELFKRIYKLQDDRGELMLEQQVYLALVGRLAQTDTTDEELRKLVATDAVEHNKSVADLYASWFDLSTHAAAAQSLARRPQHRRPGAGQLHRGHQAQPAVRQPAVPAEARDPDRIDRQQRR